ncbi:hypothetical protein B0A55_04069 [Friedmanniomyces simplex]|uniref:Uncharacterized protein n=1 Tax=Friedmanniomyces simplex TaxID=329884 RepID=A0A4U0XT73_9PEZI|nr:hypothetical protein B0A55_04069 [Friedmanniomyces simplex]
MKGQRDGRDDGVRTRTWPIFATAAAVAGKGKVNGVGHGLGKKAGVLGVGKGGKGGGGQLVEGSGAQIDEEDVGTTGKGAPGGNETPVAQSNGDVGGVGGVLEATPAFGGGEMIR